MSGRWTGGQQLQADRDLLRLLDVDTSKLSATEARLGAELVRRIVERDGVPGADQRRGPASEAWQRFCEAKGVMPSTPRA
jgi:hypothetical protein